MVNTSYPSYMVNMPWLGRKPFFRNCSVILHNNNNNNRFTALCPGLPRWAGTSRNIHPPTILIIQFLSASSIYHDPYHPPRSNYVLGNLFAQPLSMSSLVTSWSGALHLIFHTFLHPIIVFFSQHMPIPSQPILLYISYHLFLVYLSTPYLELYLLC